MADWANDLDDLLGQLETKKKETGSFLGVPPPAKKQVQTVIFLNLDLTLYNSHQRDQYLK